jgi:hypothetical protein
VKLWLAMPENKTKERDIDPQCVRCGSKMRLSCTEPDTPGFVHHVYECIKCRSTQSFVTAVYGRLGRRSLFYRADRNASPSHYLELWQRDRTIARFDTKTYGGGWHHGRRW